jgi:hypothetical protein
MASSLEEFQEILDAESLVDISRLREAARHGIPEEVFLNIWLQ